MVILHFLLDSDFTPLSQANKPRTPLQSPSVCAEALPRAPSCIDLLLEPSENLHSNIASSHPCAPSESFPSPCVSSSPSVVDEACDLELNLPPVAETPTNPEVSSYGENPHSKASPSRSSALSHRLGISHATSDGGKPSHVSHVEESSKLSEVHAANELAANKVVHASPNDANGAPISSSKVAHNGVTGLKANIGRTTDYSKLQEANLSKDDRFDVESSIDILFASLPELAGGKSFFFFSATVFHREYGHCLYMIF